MGTLGQQEYNDNGGIVREGAKEFMDNRGFFVDMDEWIGREEETSVGAVVEIMDEQEGNFFYQ